ncbi:MAG TPA: outer membrane beta-barrel protein [Gemmatimonadales bacterium]|nr:outer membrane beta-barrel protein [Gemmatimonadales bacterium]
MGNRIGRTAGLVLATSVALSGLGVAQQADSGAAAHRLALSGFAEASYTYSTRGGSNQISGRLYDRFHNEFMLNALTLAADVPYNPATLSSGVHAELLFGQNAAVIKSAGLDLGSQGDLPQLYVTLNVPTHDGNGVQFKLGKMPTLLGFEVLEDVVNPNWSEGNQFIYVENFTGTGLSIEHKFSPRADAQLRVFNGWDLVKDNNARKSFMGRAGWYPRDSTSIALVGYVGPEEAADPSAERYGGQLLAGTRVARGTTAWVQGDIGKEQANAALPDPTKDAEWWAVGAWITRNFSPKLGLAVRGDYVDDRNGARTSGVLGFPSNTGQRFGSATATLSVRSWQGILLRPELRFDRSSLPAFDGRQDQVTVALSAAYLY